MANQDFNSTVSSLFQGMDNFITSKTVVGEPKQVGDVILLPLIEVAFGVGAGAFLDKDGNKKIQGYFSNPWMLKITWRRDKRRKRCNPFKRFQPAKYPRKRSA